MGINSKLDVTGGEVHTYGAQYKTAVDAVKPARSDLRVIMDRNLGATGALYSLSTTNAQSYPTYGLLYQWGRPTPFQKVAAGISGNLGATQPTYLADGATVTNYPITVQGPVTIAEATQNPQKFYYYNISPYDWISSRNNALWGDGTTKSVYDPCPEGWRIPPNVWIDFVGWRTGPYGDLGCYKNSAWVEDPINLEIAGGVYYGGTAGAVKTFYPVPGWRDSGNNNGAGGFFGVGNYLFLWTSTPSGGYSSVLNLTASRVNPGNSYGRAGGLSVRCIQE